MEYVYGTLSSVYNGTQYLQIQYIANQSVVTTNRPVNVNNTTKKFYFMIPTNIINYFDVGGVYYTENSHTIYNDEIMHYSWNYGKLSYMVGDNEVPGTVLVNDYQWCLFGGDYTGSESCKELYSRTYQYDTCDFYDFSNYCDGATALRKVVFNNHHLLATLESRYILQYAFRNCTNLRFCDLGNTVQSSNDQNRGLYGTFLNCTDITINVRDCDFSGIETLSTTSSRKFVEDVSTVRIIYDTLAKLGAMQTYFPNVTYTQWAILCETQAQGDNIYAMPYNGSDWIGGVDGAYNNNDVIVSIHEGLSNSAQVMSDHNYRSFFEYNDCVVKADFSILDTSLVTNMRQMFYGCTSLQELNLGGRFNTMSVTDYAGFLGSGSSCVPTTCIIYYNKNTMKQDIIDDYPDYNWVAVDENFRIF